MESVNKQLTHRQRQALATRKLIVDSAISLFLEQGYAATTIEAIAAHAGVAVSTIYSIFTNKRGVLSEIRQKWHAESEAKSIFAEAAAQNDPVYFLDRIAYGTRRQWETSATMMAIYNSAAASDAEAAAELEKALKGRRANLSQFIEQIYPKLRQDLTLEQTCAVLLALTRTEIYNELVVVAGWSLDDYEAWLAGVLKQQLLPNPES